MARPDGDEGSPCAEVSTQKHEKKWFWSIWVLVEVHPAQYRLETSHESPKAPLKEFLYVTCGQIPPLWKVHPAMGVCPSYAVCSEMQYIRLLGQRDRVVSAYCLFSDML